ncbi:hypothetical protein DFJ74DRAFT_48686 [Hyaloraphidium curvatum]|nr:hypothetical protein DFJ74DRAFT_48686 [Hyaloraphidium curvatum]
MLRRLEIPVVRQGVANEESRTSRWPSIPLPSDEQGGVAVHEAWSARSSPSSTCPFPQRPPRCSMSRRRDGDASVLLPKHGLHGSQLVRPQVRRQALEHELLCRRQPASLLGEERRTKAAQLEHLQSVQGAEGRRKHRRTVLVTVVILGAPVLANVEPGRRELGAAEKCVGKDELVPRQGKDSCGRYDPAQRDEAVEKVLRGVESVQLEASQLPGGPERRGELGSPVGNQTRPGQELQRRWQTNGRVRMAVAALGRAHRELLQFLHARNEPQEEAVVFPIRGQIEFSEISKESEVAVLSGGGVQERRRPDVPGFDARKKNGKNKFLCRFRREGALQEAGFAAGVVQDAKHDAQNLGRQRRPVLLRSAGGRFRGIGRVGEFGLGRCRVHRVGYGRAGGGLSLLVGRPQSPRVFKLQLGSRPPHSTGKRNRRSFIDKHLSSHATNWSERSCAVGYTLSVFARWFRSE